MRNLKLETRNWKFGARDAFVLVALLLAGCQLTPTAMPDGWEGMTEAQLAAAVQEEALAGMVGEGLTFGQTDPAVVAELQELVDGQMTEVVADEGSAPVAEPVRLAGESSSPYASIVEKYIGFGWNYVDGTAPDYNGWYGHLSDCEYDIEFSALVWNSYGVDAVYLLTENATRASIRAMLDAAVAELPEDSVIFVDTSGHGADLPNLTGDPTEASNQAMAAYDGFILDDTVWGWLQEQEKRIHFVWRVDTCHSGDMVRDPFVFSRDVPRGFSGSVLLLAGCAKDETSMSTGRGGAWHIANWAATPVGRTVRGLFDASLALTDPADQVPVYAEYGSVPDWLRDAVLVWEVE